MKTQRAAVVALLALGLACSTVQQAVNPATPTPLPTATPAATATLAPTATIAPTATLAPTATVPPPTATATAAPAAYVPPGCENTPPATILPATTVAQPTPGLQANPEIGTDEQLRVFDEVVAKIDQVYLYPDFNGKDWPAITADYRSRIQAGMDTEAFYTQMSSLLQELGDEHSHFESPVEKAAAQAELAGRIDFVGIGALLLPLPEKEHVTVLLVFPDSSAFYGGLEPHDSILAVDGLPIVEDGAAHPERVRGPECSAAVLTLQSPGEARRDVTFIRNRITSSVPVDARLAPTTDGSRIGYIFLASFFDETIPGEVKQALEDFGPLDGLILDNRMNGGGSSDVLEPILSYFTSGAAGFFESRSASRELSIRADPVLNSQTVPLIVLVGTGTVSFGEVFSGILQDTGRAKIVGETTLGNVETLHGYTFEDGSRIWIAEERFDPLISHANWEQTGIVPDVEAFADWDTFTFDTDPAVAAAVQLLGHH